MKYYFVISCCFIVVGCGGSSQEQTNQVNTQPQNSVQQITQQTAQPTTPTSTLLIDNLADDKFQFSQFSDHTLVIDPQSYGFSADTVFVKVYTEDGNTLFLGKISGVLNLNLYLENIKSKVIIDMFSIVSGDPQITQEINL
ncbi:hypothetical protein [Pseudoalteromonas sp. S16_S37]|uniref:hypothetical protein n=1 Tax=Pseudoalteromonas sp. S16_S37 TaxID=2720228 RepID=UPI0016807064|nr:hypothetical protein [Pseudoalteromonas sp. S16_S37]MBD1582139.1 hypothetical protein [Pseudoalteromonas sp. S16_S37]